MRDLDIISRGLCDGNEEKKCREEVGDGLLEWTCSQCEKKKPTEISEYTWKILRLRRLRLAGYPFSPDDLTPEEWLDLGRAEEWMQTRLRSREHADLISMLCMR